MYAFKYVCVCAYTDVDRSIFVRIQMNVHTYIWQRTQVTAHCNALQLAATHCNTLPAASNSDSASACLFRTSSDMSPGVCYSVSQCVAVCRSVSQCVAVCYIVWNKKLRSELRAIYNLQCVAVCCSTLQYVAVYSKEHPICHLPRVAQC